MLTEELYNIIGQRIKQQRKNLDWSQEILAAKSGISLSFLGHIERGTRKLSVDTLYRLAISLNCSVSELCPAGELQSPNAKSMLIYELEKLLKQLKEEQFHSDTE